MRTGRIDDFSGKGGDGSRLLVDISVAAEVAGIVVDDLVISRARNRG